MLLTIPERHKPGLISFIKLSPSAADSLLAALGSAPPGLSSGILAKSLESEEVPAGELQPILFALASLILTAYDLQIPTDEVARDVAMSAATERLGGLEPGSPSVESFRGRLSAFLKNRTLQVTAKAASVMVQHPATYSSARILTDLRPVFLDETPPLIGAAVIVHVLQISTLQGGEPQHLFVALDSADLVALGRVLDRATAKEAALREAVASTQMNILHPPTTS